MSRRGFSKLLMDFKYSSMIILLVYMIVLCWIPLKILGLFFGDACTRGFCNLFKKFD